MYRSGTSRRQRSRSRSRDHDLRNEMDRGRRDDRGHDYHEDGRRPDARDQVLDRDQRDDHNRRGDGSWAWGPRSSTDDGRGGAPLPSGGRQFETRYDSQALQHQSRSEAMAVRNSDARRDEPSQSSEFRVYSSLTRQTDQDSPISRSWRATANAAIRTYECTCKHQPRAHTGKVITVQLYARGAACSPHSITECGQQVCTQFHRPLSEACVVRTRTWLKGSGSAASLAVYLPHI